MPLPSPLKSWILLLCAYAAVQLFSSLYEVEALSSSPGTLSASSSGSGDSDNNIKFVDTVDMEVDGDLTGWSLVTDNSEIPPAFLFDEVNGKIKNSVNGPYLGLACFKNILAKLVFVKGNNYPDPKLPGFDSSTNFSSENLLRFNVFNGKGEMTVARKDNQMFWSANFANRTVSYGAEAAKFKMYINKNKDIAFFQIDKYFVTVSGYETRFILTSVLTTNGLFRAPSIGSIDTMSKQGVDIVHEIDDYILETRRLALSKGVQLSSMWAAYDAALAAGALNINLNKLTATGWTEEDVLQSTRKVFFLITQKLQNEYKSLSKYPPQFDLHKFASGIQTVNEKAWIEGMATLFTVELTDNSWSVYLYGRAVLASARMKDIEDGTKVFLDEKFDNEPTLMRIWFRASCGLARIDSTASTLAEKVDATSILTNRFKPSSILAFDETQAFQRFWFNNLLNTTLQSTSQETLVIMELSLLKHLPSDFLKLNSIVGESISRSLFNEIDQAIESPGGINMDQLYTILNDPKTKQILQVADIFCISKKIEINLCTLPQLFRQVLLFNLQKQRNEIENSKMITKLTQTSTTSSTNSGDTLNYQIYIDQLIQDKNFYLIRSKIVQAKNQYLEKAKNFFQQLDEKIEDSTLFETIKTSTLIQQNAQNLAEYLGKAANFKKNAFQVQLNRKIEYIQRGIEKANEIMVRYTDTLRRLGVKAKAVAITDAIVSLIDASLDTFLVGYSLTGKGVGIGDGGGGGKGFDIGGINEVLGGIQRSMAKIKDSKDIFNLAEYMNEMVEETKLVTAKVATILPQVIAVRAAILPLVSNKTYTEVEYQNFAQDFLLAIQNYQTSPPSTQVNSLETRLGILGEKLCSQSQMLADIDCVKIGQDNPLVFGNLQEALIHSEYALNTLTDLASEAVSERSAKLLFDKITNIPWESTSELSEKWKNDERARQKFWFQWKKQQEYLQAVTRVGIVLNQVYILQALAQKCNLETYSNGGKPSVNCQNIIYQPGHLISDVDIDILLSSKVSQVERTMVSNVAKLPIAPQFVGDLAFIDIASLMKGNTVYFQLPSQNKTWLEENNWIDDTSDLDTSVYYVTKMYVQLLPRYAKYATEEASVAIIVSSSGVSQLGPALKNKTFIIPERSYVTKYDQMPSEEISDTCLLPPYSACDDRIPVYCKRSDGSSNAQDVSLNPSLFSQWSMTATFDDNPENLGVIRYRSLATNPYVYVQYEMIKFSLAEDSSRRLRSSKSHQDLQQRRALRAQQETNNNICCPNGEYRTRVDGENVCVACPDKSISQLGGLYCMYPIFNLTTLAPSSISL